MFVLCNWFACLSFGKQERTQYRNVLYPVLRGHIYRETSPGIPATDPIREKSSFIFRSWMIKASEPGRSPTEAANSCKWRESIGKKGRTFRWSRIPHDTIPFISSPVQSGMYRWSGVIYGQNGWTCTLATDNRCNYGRIGKQANSGGALTRATKLTRVFLRENASG